MARSPLRFLAPIALIAFAFALYNVVQDSSAPSGEVEATPTATATATAASKKKSTKRKTYTVKSGDTASGIAEKTGVDLQTLIDLNPDLDPSTLAPGQKIRLDE